MKHLIAILFTACALAQTGSWPTAATDQDLIVAKTGATSTLSTGINASTLTVVVADGSKFAQYSIIRIDDEYMQICSIATNTLTLCTGTRGLVGSASSHLAGATVRDVVSEYHHNRLRAELKAMQARLLPGRSGTELPESCNVTPRELFLLTTTQAIYACNGDGNGWDLVSADGDGADPPYTATVSAQTSVTVTAATHGQGTLATAVCFDNSTPREMVACGYTRASNGDFVFSFSPAFTGLVQIGAGGGGGGSAAWGAITGTLSDQTDLNSALAAKAPAANPTFSGTVTTPITGSTQCVQVNTSGVLSGTGSACGAGGGTTYAAGPSGLVVIDTAPSPDTIDLDTALICTKAGTCAPTGLQDFSGAAGVIIKEGTPVNSSATCTKGMVLYDAFYTYFCVATNSWKRLTLETF